MLDIGFIRDIRKILKVLPSERQNLLFSAMFSQEIRRLAADLLDRLGRRQQVSPPIGLPPRVLENEEIGHDAGHVR